MHQYPRPPSRPSSAASSPPTHLAGTINQQNMMSGNMSTTKGMVEGDMDVGEAIPRLSEAEIKASQKINQVIQQFFVKAALTVISARMFLPQSFNKSAELKQNKWFNVIIDDTDVLAEGLVEWKTVDAMRNRPPPLCVEIFLDMKDLASGQTLVVFDDYGKRWEVAEAINTPQDPSARSSHRPKKATHVLLERWRIEIGDKDSVAPMELKDPLPNVYKKAVVLFRSLYTHTRLLPCWKYHRRVARQPPSHPSLKLKYRISNGGDIQSGEQDTLDIPIYPSSEPVSERYYFNPSNSPVGPLRISVAYRANCDFRVTDAESLLSSRFMGLDDHYFKPSLPAGSTAGQVPGSLPVNRNQFPNEPDHSQAYGSLSTFHQVGPATGTSPISALRAASDMPLHSPPGSPVQKYPPNQRITPSTGAHQSTDRNVAGQRRTSVSFQPFKAGSLSSSPALSSQPVASPGSPLGRPLTLGNIGQARHRLSITALPQTALRTPSISNETAIVSSASSSPKPAPIHRYSSSFGHRRGRFSTSGSSKIEDDNISSGKASITSSVPPGSDAPNEAEAASSGSIKTDDENISDFLKLLEQKKDLRSFSRRDSTQRDASMKRTTAALAKFQSVRDSNANLSDSLNASLLLHRSSSSSSRQLASVPAMMAGTSVSTSSSPGKPISPHTPHTPAIPSRLSANSIVEYEAPIRSRARGLARREGQQQPEVSNQSITGEPGTNAIDIPTSPTSRPWPYVRRASSASPPNRALEDDTDLFGMRGSSLPNDDRPDLSLSELLRLQESTPNSPDPSRPQLEERNEDIEDPVDDAAIQSDDMDHDNGAPRPSYISRVTHPSRNRGHGRGRPSDNDNGLDGSGTGIASLRGSRYSFTSRATADDEEPLLFYMSEIGAHSRRSLEEGRGGMGSGQSDRRRGGSPWHGPR